MAVLQDRSGHPGSKNMQKKTPARNASAIALHRETLRQLGTSELQGIRAGGRLRVPVGYADDTSPVYSYVDDTNP
jgi:hypothetical protein